MDRNEYPDPRFVNRNFAWTSSLAFSFAEGSACQHGAPHTLSQIDVKAALYGRWDEVIVAEIDGPYIVFATRDGFKKMWSHAPDLLEILDRSMDEGDGVWWSEEEKLIAISFVDVTLMIGLDEGVATRCDVRAEIDWR